jgi:hypothetical protein
MISLCHELAAVARILDEVAIWEGMALIDLDPNRNLPLLCQGLRIWASFPLEASGREGFAKQFAKLRQAWSVTSAPVSPSILKLEEPLPQRPNARTPERPNARTPERPNTRTPERV